MTPQENARYTANFSDLLHNGRPVARVIPYKDGLKAVDLCDALNETKRLQARVEQLERELRGANERVCLLFDAKNEWADRAREAEQARDALTQERDQARAEVALRGMARNQLKQGAEALRTALRKYGDHEEFCNVLVDKPCDCGFAEASGERPDKEFGGSRQVEQGRAQSTPVVTASPSRTESGELGSGAQGNPAGESRQSPSPAQVSAELRTQKTADSLTLEQYVLRQEEWSSRTFGHGPRTLGVTRHIEKEIAEIREKPHDLSEWVDVVILALDGYWRHGGNSRDIMKHLTAKQEKNFAREWPKPTSQDDAIEHVRSVTQSAPCPPQHGVSCVKRYHLAGQAGRGYMHEPDDDRPYDVDGIMYCGRCHEFIEGTGVETKA